MIFHHLHLNPLNGFMQSLLLNVEDNGQEQAPVVNNKLVGIKKLMSLLDELLRGKNYLDTYLRNKVKERLTIAGYEASGYRVIAMFPGKSELVFKNATELINNLHKFLKTSIRNLH